MHRRCRASHRDRETDFALIAGQLPHLDLLWVPRSNPLRPLVDQARLTVLADFQGDQQPADLAVPVGDNVLDGDQRL